MERSFEDAAAVTDCRRGRARYRPNCRYSRRRWGSAVAIRHVTGLWQAIGRIQRIPSIGSNYSEILEGVRRYRFRSHTIYYVVLKDSVRIVRILHVRMSPERHLPD